MKIYKSLLAVILALLIQSNTWAQNSTANVEKVKADSKMKWWTDARFGLFLHWGLYSVTAGDWKGKPAKGAEHFMLYERIPWKEYAHIANDFNPIGFDADSWAKIAKNAGMKYVVITAKHHDGFAMYDSKSSDYNIVKRTPYGKDPMKALAEACKKQGVKLCFYYSLGRDWQDPDVPTNRPVKGGRSNTWDYPYEDKKDFTKYFERKVKPQIKELLTQYGPVEVIWFDTPDTYITKVQSQELVDLIHSIQPNCIVNDRVGNGLGDFNVLEQAIAGKSPAKPWESCITISTNWGYNKYDTAWKSPELLVRQLIEITSKGGNFLLNTGPKGDGTIPQKSIERFKIIGDWMKVNGEAIYGTHSWKINVENMEEAQTKREDEAPIVIEKTSKDAVNDFTSKEIFPEARFTTKDDNLYMFACSWQKNKALIKSLSTTNCGKIKSVKPLGRKTKIEWEQDETGLNINLPSIKNDEINVQVLKISFN
jgi:alpha-L-fucosidase